MLAVADFVEQVGSELLVDSVQSHIDSLRPRTRGDVDDQRPDGFVALDPDLEQRLIGGLQSKLAADDLFRLLDQESFEYRLRPGSLDLLEVR